MKHVESFFHSITPAEITRYMEYWGSLKPETIEDKFLRWIFAFMSIHTTWEANVRGYEALKDFDQWLLRRDVLFNKIVESRAGLYNMRTKYIWDFSREFWNTPAYFDKMPQESWVECRNRLTKALNGIGMTKVSFTFEMLFPNEAEVLCLDTHMMQFFGVPKGVGFDSKKGSKIYEDAEAQWINLCKEIEVPSYIARSIYWDRNQGKEDSRYWSYVLES